MEILIPLFGIVAVFGMPLGIVVAGLTDQRNYRPAALLRKPNRKIETGMQDEHRAVQQGYLEMPRV